MGWNKRNKKRIARATIRKPHKVEDTKNKVLFLYGKLLNKEVARGYCNLHTCYLAPNDIKEKNCDRKKCKYFERRKRHYV